MKLIIAGSRYLKRTKFYFVRECIGLFGIENITEIVSGGASGVDQAGEVFAQEYQLEVKYFQPNWKKYDKAAGPIRNKEMANYADSLLLIWDGRSKGSESIKNEMLKLKKPVYEIIVRWT